MTTIVNAVTIMRSMFMNQIMIMIMMLSMLAILIMSML